jgi:hypothetical protein
MRRLLTVLALAGLLAGSIGCCNHIAGICDCNIPGHTCCMPCGWHHLAPGAWVAPKVDAGPKGEPIPKPEPAKGDGKDKAPEVKGDGLGMR